MVAGERERERGALRRHTVFSWDGQPSLGNVSGGKLCVAEMGKHGK